MLCCSINCEKFKTCGHAYHNNPRVHENLEPFDSFGHSSYCYNSETEQVEIKRSVMCQNYNMYYPKIQGEKE